MEISCPKQNMLSLSIKFVVDKHSKISYTKYQVINIPIALMKKGPLGAVFQRAGESCDAGTWLMSLSLSEHDLGTSI